MPNLNTFIHYDFLLTNAFASRLYHQYAAELPVIDYHGHLSPAAIADNTMFPTLTSVWLAGDHYKWRAMRALGIHERYITGTATDEEKFNQWAGAIPYTIRNPLFHWSHLELKRYFGIDQLLTSETASGIYRAANSLLGQPEYSTQGLLKKMKVEFIGTTDDPVDNLTHHARIATHPGNIKVAPSFRPDQIYFINRPSFRSYLEKLETTVGFTIRTWTQLLDAVDARISFFHDHGCRIADHGLESLPAEIHSESPEHAFTRRLAGEVLHPLEESTYQFHLLKHLCTRYFEKGWVQQFHLGALRNNSSRMTATLGPDTGFDSIGDFSQAKHLSHFLDALDRKDQLAKTILYNLNPSWNEVFATMAGNFNDGSVKGKIQYGAAWWFLDQKDGIEKQLNTLSNFGLLSTFVGMLTDSRSFLSFPRHEYFRRVLCNLLGQEVAAGVLPSDEAWLGKIVSDVCYYNAKAYFNL